MGGQFTLPSFDGVDDEPLEDFREGVEKIRHNIDDDQEKGTETAALLALHANRLRLDEYRRASNIATDAFEEALTVGAYPDRHRRFYTAAAAFRDEHDERDTLIPRGATPKQDDIALMLYAVYLFMREKTREYLRMIYKEPIDETSFEFCHLAGLLPPTSSQKKKRERYSCIASP